MLTYIFRISFTDHMSIENALTCNRFFFFCHFSLDSLGSNISLQVLLTTAVHTVFDVAGGFLSLGLAINSICSSIPEPLHPAIHPSIHKADIKHTHNMSKAAFTLCHNYEILICKKCSHPCRTHNYN